jgi:hypothetical protein
MTIPLTPLQFTSRGRWNRQRQAGSLKKFALCAPPAVWQVWDVSTLTIELPDDLAARLEAASAQTHVPPAQLVRAALEKALPAPAADWPADGPSLYERMKDFIGCIESGVTDLATNPKYMEGFGQWRR